MKIRLENINMDYVEAPVESILTDLLASDVAVEAKVEDGFVYLEGMDVGFEEEALLSMTNSWEQRYTEIHSI